MTSIESIPQQGLGPMFDVVPRGNLALIRTPFWYPDGGVVDVFVKEHGDNFTLTDLKAGRTRLAC
jgi:hypothetical protein